MFDSIKRLFRFGTTPEVISIEGPVETIDGQLVLRIPFSHGGEKLAALTTKLGVVEDGFLKIVIQPWLAERLRIGSGSLVCVDNANGKFTITRSAANDVSTESNA